MGIAPPPGRATYHAPSDVMAEIPHNDQVKILKPCKIFALPKKMFSSRRLTHLQILADQR